MNDMSNILKELRSMILKFSSKQNVSEILKIQFGKRYGIQKLRNERPQILIF